MKTYNKYPAVNRLHINKDCRVYKTSDDKMCITKGLNALDFCLWFDETLLKNFVDFQKNPFNVILQFIDNKEDNFIIYSNKVRNNYRLACLIYHSFVNCDVDKVKAMETEYLEDHSNVSINGKNYDNVVDWEQILDYDKIKANKLIFPYFRNKDIEIPLISELLSRELLAFDNKFRNLIFIGRDSYCKYGLEKHGITDKHFLRIEGKKFPFCYWYEREEKRDFKQFKNLVLYSDTIEMLEEISTLRCEGGIDKDTLYCSLHTANFSEYCLENLLELLSDDINIKYTFNIPAETKNKLNPGEKVLPEKKEEVRTPEIDIIEENLRIFYKDDSIRFSGTRYDGEKIYYSERDKIYFNSKGKLSEQEDEELPF